jgi:hypothetical protein
MAAILGADHRRRRRNEAVTEIDDSLRLVDRHRRRCREAGSQNRPGDRKPVARARQALI